jgi:hypothetical protein
LDFHHFKDPVEDQEEMAAVEVMAVEIQEETVAKEIVVQEDQMMVQDTEDQVQGHKENLLAMQVIKVEQRDREDHKENPQEMLQEHKAEQ